MKKRQRVFWGALVLLVAVGVMGLPAGGATSSLAQEKTSTIWRFSWTVPTSGSGPAYYVAEIRRDDDEVLTISHIAGTDLNISVDYGHDYEIRVAAVDDQNRQGPFSGWSERQTCELIPPRL